MKKNKTIGFMLAATLLVGGTFMGTKAWFTDQAEANANLTITTGSMDLEVSEGDWTKVGDSESTPESGNTFTNVRPGDKFTKTVTVTNEGTLKQKLSVTGGDKKADAPDDYFTVETTAKDLEKDTVEGNGGEKTFNITVKVEGNKMSSDKDNKDNEKSTFDLNKYMNQITINADQINKSEEV